MTFCYGKPTAFISNKWFITISMHFTIFLYVTWMKREGMDLVFLSVIHVKSDLWFLRLIKCFTFYVLLCVYVYAGFCVWHVLFGLLVNKLHWSKQGNLIHLEAFMTNMSFTLLFSFMSWRAYFLVDQKTTLSKNRCVVHQNLCFNLSSRVVTIFC